MTFSQALEEMKAGARVRRRGWQSGLFITQHDDFEVRNAQAFSDDWEIVFYQSPPSVPQPPPTIEELRQAIVAVSKAASRYASVVEEESLFAAVAKIRRSGD